MDQGGARGGETGQNTRWKVEREEVKESDRGFKASGSILINHSLAGKLALPSLAAGGREGLFCSLQWKKPVVVESSLLGKPRFRPPPDTHTHPHPHPPTRSRPGSTPSPVLAPAYSSHSQGLGG